MQNYKEDNMEEYKHYIRTNESGVVILGFSSAFPEIATPQQGDLLLSGKDGRHFSTKLTNDRGQYIYRVVNGVMLERPKSELDEELTLYPPSLQEQVDEMKLLLGDLLLFGGV